MSDMRTVPVIFCVILAAMTLIAFGQVRNNDFINLDDNLYLTDNPYIRQGLTIRGIRWAFTSTYFGHYHPVTWLSHMLDYELFKLDPKGHHAVNLFLHIANTLGLFLILLRITRKQWQSGFVAALFAIHPLHVESVAWAAERKDLLCAFFWMFTLWVYACYVEKPGLKRFFLVLLLFALALLSKPMAVTLPFCLLLLDYWPLEKFRLDSRKSLSRLILEKTPLLLLSVGLCVLTILSHSEVGTISSLDRLPLGVRLQNALISYVKYIEKMFWPNPLAVLYPHPIRFPLWQVAGAALLLITLTLIALFLRKRHPYAIVGWLWYLGTLVPVIGIVQAGPQAMADRFTYLPMIGLFIVVVYGIPGLFARKRLVKIAFAISGGLVLTLLAFLTLCQVNHWQNSMTLFTHTLGVTTNNFIIHNNLGVTLMRQGMTSEAMSHFLKALSIRPTYADAHQNIGNLLSCQGKVQEAIVYLSEALRLAPEKPGLHNDLGVFLFRQGKKQEAIGHFREAVRLNPNYGESYLNLGIVFLSMGKNQEAISCLNKALQISSGDTRVHNNLGVAFVRTGEPGKAFDHYTEALRIDSKNRETRFNMGNLLAAQGRDEEASVHYEKVLKSEPADGEAHYELGVVLDRLGRKKEAVVHLAEAVRLTSNPGKVRFTLGVVYFEMGRKDLALREYQALLAINPDLARALIQKITRIAK